MFKFLCLVFDFLLLFHVIGAVPYIKIGPREGIGFICVNTNSFLNIFQKVLNGKFIVYSIPINGISYDLDINEKGLISVVGDEWSLLYPSSNKVINTIDEEFLNKTSSDDYSLHCAYENLVRNYDLRNGKFTENEFDSEITKIKYFNNNLMVSTNTSIYIKENKINLNY